ncbi:thioredoxin domain-containing protein [Candidatus Saccharibacteria bacterium]|nr:thioredoxin domain-containing protein [Candidatus Saccharibacteria bacterium]
MQKTARIIGVVAVVVLLFAAIIASMNAKPSNSDKMWDEAMTIGNPEAKNYFVIYSDIVCPYCIAFENAIVEHEEEFKQYLEDNDVLLEIRLSDFLYEYGETNPINSKYSAVASYCARNEGKFWDYYNLAISTVWNDYFKQSGKSALSQMSKLDKKYWINLGKKVGLDEEFATCVENDEPLAEIQERAAKTAKLVSGLPAFKLNSYSPPGFSLDGTWEDVKAYFDEGLRS